MERTHKVKAARVALSGEILSADFYIDICDDFRTLVSDPAYWKGIAAVESLFKTISCCLTCLEVDKVTFATVYTCFLAIKYHSKTLDRSVMNALQLNDDDITDMIILIHHQFSKIYSEAHGLALATDPLFNTMRYSILVKSGEGFVQLGKGSINHQCKMAITRISMGNEALRHSMLTEFAAFLIRQRTQTIILTMWSLNRQSCRLYVMNRSTGQSRALCLQCIGTRLAQVAASAIIKLPKTFILVTVLEWVGQKLGQGPQQCSVQGNLMVGSKERKIRRLPNVCSI